MEQVVSIRVAVWAIVHAGLACIDNIAVIGCCSLEHLCHAETLLLNMRNWPICMAGWFKNMHSMVDHLSL